MANENKDATGIYYYHTENITESRLDFWIQVAEPDYEQSDWHRMWYMYRLHDGDAVVQHLDGIITKQDRRIVFPSIYQHQAEWYPVIKVLQKIEPSLPLEVGQMNVGLLDRSKLMEVKEAKKHREELMEERKFFVKTTNDKVFARPFSLCEH
ncbi:hypothetical protein BG015_009290 [Linnemannia schmuckeri]|uniref:DUF4246 domain-containing protein n=1 Tax=Linnemannia schmuckeri TaxID=64567 RepID=A0A9P5RVR6_9FUNG|nr:hypothetical protein BG015_009290 [Linnemannia schmuckeri]